MKARGARKGESVLTSIAMEPKSFPPATGQQPELPKFFYRLSPGAQRCYLKSDAIDRFEFQPGQNALTLVEALLKELEGGTIAPINRASQELANELCRLLGVRPVEIAVRGVRPHNQRGELHGIFFPNARPPQIILWMRTARRHDIVKPKTFVRTLLHELGHYLDYSLLKLGGSYHTRGFFKRESFLVRLLYPPLETESPG